MEANSLQPLLYRFFHLCYKKIYRYLIKIKAGFLAGVKTVPLIFSYDIINFKLKVLGNYAYRNGI